MPRREVEDAACAGQAWPKRSGDHACRCRHGADRLDSGVAHQLGTAGRRRRHPCHPNSGRYRRELGRHGAGLRLGPGGAGGGWHEDHSPANIRREIEASLRNLRTDHVDLYQFHDPDPATPIERSWDTMQELIAEGKVRWGGLSNHPPELVARALTVGPVASLQEQYSLLHREIERDVLPFAERHAIGVLPWSPPARGFLADGLLLAPPDPPGFRR